MVCYSSIFVYKVVDARSAVRGTVGMHHPASARFAVSIASYVKVNKLDLQGSLKSYFKLKLGSGVYKTMGPSDSVLKT